MQSVHEEWRVYGTAQASPRTATTQKILLGSGRRQLLSSHLQSPISKFIERVVVSRLSHHMSTFNLLPDQQSAYPSFHSTETALPLAIVQRGRATP